jgi:hypothetical protein
MRGQYRWRTALLAGSVAMAACSGQQAPVEAPTRAVPPDCQAFIDHFRPVAIQLLDVRVFAVGEAYLPLLRPSRDTARVDAIAAFLERPSPPAPKAAPTLLDGMQEIVREQTVDSRGLLAALSRGDLESYRRLGIRYRSSRERLGSLDDNLEASCGAHLLPRGRLPFAQVVATFQKRDAAFRKCHKAGLARNPGIADRLDVSVVVDDRGTVLKAEVDPRATEPPIDPGTEPFFQQLGYEGARTPDNALRPMTDQGVVQCVLGEVKALRFDAVHGGAIVRFPVMFNGQTPMAPSDD